MRGLAKIFFDARSNDLARSPRRGAGSIRVSLARGGAVTRISTLRLPSPVPLMHDELRSFTQTVNGRAVVIEALPVDQNRWRARIARAHGGPTAVMPFYGATPDEAVARLTDWLTRVALTKRS